MKTYGLDSDGGTGNFRKVFQVSQGVYEPTVFMYDFRLVTKATSCDLRVSLRTQSRVGTSRETKDVKHLGGIPPRLAGRWSSEPTSS